MQENMAISVERAVAAVVFATMALGTAASADQQQTAPPQRDTGPAANAAARPISPEVLSGVWDYNDQLSVDAATGRAERAPRSATNRANQPGGAPPSSGGSGSGAPRPPNTGGGVSGGGGGFEGGGRPDGFDEARRAMAAVIAAERRTYVRDLLEVPETLKIRASATEVIMSDDLSRERTYVADGKLQKYQLGAARYEARSAWTSTYFRKEIEGSNGFKMSETYFISEDGRRLFVIIRIGDPKKPETLAGVNRVYDRVDGLH